jgi:hypothetical protein
MIFAQSRYLWRYRGGIESMPWPLSFSKLSHGFFCEQSPPDAHAQVKDKHCQDDQPECK